MLSCTQSYPWWEFPVGIVIGFVITVLAVWKFRLKGFLAVAGICGIVFILTLIHLSRHGCLAQRESATLTR